jgi:hypothetical protein
MKKPLTRAESDLLLAEIEAVLRKAARGRGTRPRYLTAYQILARLNAQTRTALINRYAPPGKNAKRHFSAASLVARVADRGVRAKRFERAYLDTRDLYFEVRGVPYGVIAGYPVCGLYRSIK